MIDELAKAVFMADAEGHPLTQWDDLNDEIKEHVRRIARAVLARLREPTAAMFNAGQSVIRRQGQETCSRQVDCESVFRAMIDAAGQ